MLLDTDQQKIVLLESEEDNESTEEREGEEENQKERDEINSYAYYLKSLIHFGSEPSYFDNFSTNWINHFREIMTPPPEHHQA